MSPTLILIALLALGALAVSQKNSIGDVITVNVQSDAFTKYDDLFHKYSAQCRVPWRWLKAVAWVESDLGRNASVLAGLANPGGEDGWSSDHLSRGLMQMTLETANRRRVRPGTTLAELDDPEVSVYCAGKFIYELAQNYFAWDRESVARGYNGGPGWRDSSEESLAETAAYYAKFKKKLASILDAQPGDEMEIG